MGRTRRISGRCDVLPSIMYGSFRAITSPSLSFSMVSSVTLSMSCSLTKSGSACITISLCLLDQDVPETVHGTGVTRLYHRRGVVLHDDSRTGDHVSGT